MRLLLSLIFIFSISAQAAEPVETAVTPVEVAATEGVAVSQTSESVEKPAVDNRKESEIPLNLEKDKKATAEGSGVFRILFTLSILGLLGTGAFFFLRKYKVPRAMKTQTQIKVLQQHYLGPKKSLAIVRVAGESLLIGITDQNISMLKSLSLLDDEVPEEAPQNFGKVLGVLNNAKADFIDAADDIEPVANSKKKVAKDLDADDEFAISGIKDIVSKRLKGMRSFQ